MELEADSSCVQPLGGSRSMHCDSTNCSVSPAADLQHSFTLHHSGGADHWSGTIAGSASDVRNIQENNMQAVRLCFIINVGWLVACSPAVFNNSSQ